MHVRRGADEDCHGDDTAQADGQHAVETRIGDLLGILEALGCAGSMQEQVVRHDSGADQAHSGQDALGASLALGQRRREQTSHDSAPVNRRSESGDKEHQAHEDDDAREDLLDQLVRANPHGGEGQNAQHDDDGDHGRIEHCLNAQDAARDVARLISGVADEDGDDNNHDCNPLQHRMRNAIADVLTQALLRDDADASRHLLEDNGCNGGEQQRPQHGVAIACAGDRARGDRAGPDETSCDQSTGADVLQLFGNRACHRSLLSYRGIPAPPLCIWGIL